MGLPFRSYRQVLDFLNRVTDYERMSGIRYTPRNYNLKRMTLLMDRLGRPERGFRSVHVAGTKGKGSTCHMIEAILRAAGYKTGLYISPHLTDMLERIQINARPIAPATFVRILNRLHPHLRAVRPTYFEIMTAAALVCFQNESVDVAVVEVGLGGRLDATNILTPDVAVITPIDYDHTDILGHTLSAIAREKTGIIKPSAPVVCAPQPPEVLRVVRRTARSVGAPLVEIGRDIRVTHTHERYTRTRDELRFDWSKGARQIRGLRLSLAGRHQVRNAATAIGAVDALSQVSPLFAKETAIRRALSRVCVAGRIQTVSRRPRVIVDSAHNPVSVRVLCETLDRMAAYRSRVLIFGTARDKDAPAMLKMLLPRFNRVIFTKSDSPRAMDPSHLVRLAVAIRPRAYLQTSTAPRALGLAADLSHEDDLILVTGSFYLAGDSLQSFKQ